MSQVRCCLVLTMIFAFGSIVECRSIETDENNDDTCSNNDPTPQKICHDPYRSSFSNNCEYFVNFGCYKDGDRLIEYADYRTPEDSTTRTVRIEFPGRDNANEFIINQIIVKNPASSKSIWNDKLSIIEGGIGYKYFKMKIRSGRSRLPEYYRLAIYGVPSKSN